MGNGNVPGFVLRQGLAVWSQPATNPGLALSAGAAGVHHTSGSVLPWSGMNYICSVNLPYFADNMFFNVSIQKTISNPQIHSHNTAINRYAER